MWLCNSLQCIGYQYVIGGTIDQPTIDWSISGSVWVLSGSNHPRQASRTVVIFLVLKILRKEGAIKHVQKDKYGWPTYCTGEKCRSMTIYLRPIFYWDQRS
jgi:hypothetical protein